MASMSCFRLFVLWARRAADRAAVTAGVSSATAVSATSKSTWHCRRTVAVCGFNSACLSRATPRSDSARHGAGLSGRIWAGCKLIGHLARASSGQRQSGFERFVNLRGPLPREPHCARVQVETCESFTLKNSRSVCSQSGENELMAGPRRRGLFRWGRPRH